MLRTSMHKLMAMGAKTSCENMCPLFNFGITLLFFIHFYSDFIIRVWVITCIRNEYTLIIRLK